VRGERALIEFRAFNPTARDVLVGSLGSKITVKESPWDCALWVVPHHEKKPWDDARVRRALTLAVDRWNGSKALSRITIVKEVGGVQVPGRLTPPPRRSWSSWPATAATSRPPARRRAASSARPACGRLRVRPQQPQPPRAVRAARDLARGPVEEDRAQRHRAHAGDGRLVPRLRAGDFEVSMDGQCGYIVEPDLDLYKFLSADRTDASYGRYTDRALDALYDRQARARDAEERRKLVREFEKRLLDEQAHVIPTLWWHRIVPYHARVRGFTITPSHFLNGQLDTIWLAE